MSDPTPEPEVSDAAETARNHFAKAVDQAQALGRQAQERVDAYREKLNDATGGWNDEAKERAFALANEGKARATGALASFGKLVADNAGLVDERVGVKYGDYARGAAKSIQDVADRIDARELDQLAEDAREFVRQSPGLALGLAAAGGFMLSRLFRRSSN